MSALSTGETQHRHPGLAPLRPLEMLLLGITSLQMPVLVVWFYDFWSWGLSGFIYDGQAILRMSFWRTLLLTVSALTPAAVFLTRMRGGSLWPWLFVAAELCAPFGWVMYWSIHGQAAPPDDRGVHGCLWIASFGCLMVLVHFAKAALLTGLIAEEKQRQEMKEGDSGPGSPG